jgi:hypothetical protein
MILVLGLNIVYVPIKLCFEIEFNNLSTIFLDTIPNFAFILEILLNFNTAVYIKGFLIKKRSEIINHYIKKRFL